MKQEEGRRNPVSSRLLPAPRGQKELLSCFSSLFFLLFLKIFMYLLACGWVHRPWCRAQGWLSPFTCWSWIFGFCCALYSRLAGSGAPRQFSCLCLLSRWRSSGITDVHYHIWHFIWDQGLNPGLQASTANTVSHLAISLALFFSLLPSLPLPFTCLLGQGLSKQTMLASNIQFCLPLTPKQWDYSYKFPHLAQVLFFQSFFFLDKIILWWNIFNHFDFTEHGRFL